MSASHGRKKRPVHEEEHENHERWAVSYADMMTVLMALFLVLYAMSSVDSQKFDALRTSLAEGFGNNALPIDGGSGLLSGSTGEPIEISPSSLSLVEPAAQDAPGADDGPGVGGGATDADKASARAEYERLEQIRQQIQEALDEIGRGDAAELKITERGLEVIVISDDVFFKNSSDAIQPGGREVLGAIGPVLAGLPDRIAIEGHTNSLPLTSGPFRSNTGLSSMRAAAVLDRLVGASGVDARRMRVVGFGETRPLVPDSDPRALEVNRRVDIVVLTPASATVKALLPTTGGSGTAAESPPAAVAGENGEPGGPEIETASAPAPQGLGPAAPDGVAPARPDAAPQGAPAPSTERNTDDEQ